MAQQAIEVLRGVPNPEQGVGAFIAFAYHGLGVACASLGRAAEARLALALSRETFLKVEHFMLVAFTMLLELRDVAMTYGASDPVARRRLAAEAEAMLARAGGALRPGVVPQLAQLGCLVLDGRWDEAQLVLRDLPAPGVSYLRREATAAQVTLALHRGESAAAWSRIDERLPEGPATVPGDAILQEGLFLQRSAAELCLDAGDLESARAWLEAHDRWIAWSEAVLGRADGQLAWAHWHLASGDFDLARAAAMDSLSLGMEPQQPLVCASAHRLLGRIAIRCGQVSVAMDHLDAARKLDDVCQTPFEHALTSLALAELNLSTGSLGEARVLLNEVRETCTRLGAAPTLRRADALAAQLSTKTANRALPVGLTQRELEVLRLLAKRLSNSEIADALFVGTRTVQTHVEHIFGKLGVNNRREAAEAAARLGLD
jgi:ATP/maltotriose-dependent transcriptional regulator MalT